MASLAKTYDQQKLFGQVYTPPFIVEKILDDIGFSNAEAILGQQILDPACGDGRFLSRVVERIIAYSDADTLAHNLTYVHGWDIDPIATDLCIAQLNQRIAAFDISVNWNIQCCDALQALTSETRFDYLIGNPPYIRIQHLEATQRQWIQQHFTFCQSGSTDIYIAFYELGLQLLAEKGVLAFITPNTFFYTNTAQPMREALVRQKNIRQLTNYGDIQLFDNATTYSAIVILDKQRHDTFLFEEAFSKSDFHQKTVAVTDLENEKFWQLSVTKTIEKTGVRLGDICKIHVGITTLRDKYYIFAAQRLDENYFIAHTKFSGAVTLESGILKPVIKASTLQSADDAISEYVLFPYQKINGKHRIIPEEVLKNLFPKAYAYLLSIKSELDKRDNGAKNTVAWYAFGRSQGLDTSFGKKILFSPMNAKPKFILHQNTEATFYSGYCLKYEGDYAELLMQLNSERMADFIAVSSRDFRGGWKSYNKKTLEEFQIVL
jgi:adenine-specific DNA-methyltransferase